MFQSYTIHTAPAVLWSFLCFSHTPYILPRQYCGAFCVSVIHHTYCPGSIVELSVFQSYTIHTAPAVLWSFLCFSHTPYILPRQYCGAFCVPVIHHTYCPGSIVELSVFQSYTIHTAPAVLWSFLCFSHTPYILPQQYCGAFCVSVILHTYCPSSIVELSVFQSYSIHTAPAAVCIFQCSSPTPYILPHQECAAFSVPVPLHTYCPIRSVQLSVFQSHSIHTAPSGVCSFQCSKPTPCILPHQECAAFNVPVPLHTYCPIRSVQLSVFQSHSIRAALAAVCSFLCSSHTSYLLAQQLYVAVGVLVILHTYCPSSCV